MKLKRRGLLARISATVVTLLMVLFSTISVAYGLGDNDGVDETPVVATEPAESTEEPAQEAEEQSSEVTEPEKAEVVEEAPPAAEAPDATEEADATETSDDSDAAADKAAADEKVEQTKADDDKAKAKEAVTAAEKTTKKPEEPKKTSAPEPKASLSPEPIEELEPAPSAYPEWPSAGDLWAVCKDGVISVKNTTESWVSRTHFGYQGPEGSVIVGATGWLAPGQAVSIPVDSSVTWLQWNTEWLNAADEDEQAEDTPDSGTCTSTPTSEPTPTEEPEPRPVDVGRDSKTGLVTATNPEGNPPVIVVVRDKDDKELERVSLKPGETGTVGTDRCEEVSIGIIVGDADEQFWGEFPAEDCTPVPTPSPTPTGTVKPSPTPTPTLDPTTPPVKPTPEPTAPEPTGSATPTPAPTQEPTKPVTPEPSPTTEPTATPSERPTAEPTSDKDGGSKDGNKDKGKKGAKPRLPKSGVSDDDPIFAIVGATVLAAAVSAGGLVAWRRRRAS